MSQHQAPISSRHPRWHQLVPDCQNLVFQYHLHSVSSSLESSSSDASSSSSSSFASNNNNNYNSNATSAQQYQDTGTLQDAKFALRCFPNWYFAYGTDVASHLLIHQHQQQQINSNHDEKINGVAATAVATLAKDNGKLPEIINDGAPCHRHYYSNREKHSEGYNYAAERMDTEEETNGDNDTAIQSTNPPSHRHTPYSNIQYLKSDGARSLTTQVFTQCLTSLRRLVLHGCIRLTDAMFQCLPHLESLHIEACNCDELTEEAFISLGSLRELKIPYSHHFADVDIENLYKAGSRLEKLDIAGCDKMTNRAMSFLKGSIKELYMPSCPLITEEGMHHISGTIRTLFLTGGRKITNKTFQCLKGVEQLRISASHDLGDDFDCRVAFKYLKGTIKHFHASNCNFDHLDEESLCHLKGLVLLDLLDCSLPQLTEAFVHLSGSLKALILDACETPRLSKSILPHLSGIGGLSISDTGIHVEYEDLPRLKQVFSDVHALNVRNDFADAATMKELVQYVEGNGGSVVIQARSHW